MHYQFLLVATSNVLTKSQLTHWRTAATPSSYHQVHTNCLVDVLRITDVSTVAAVGQCYLAGEMLRGRYDNACSCMNNANKSIFCKHVQKCLLDAKTNWRLFVKQWQKASTHTLALYTPIYSTPHVQSGRW
jgi:hypothetical protein